MVGRTLSHFKIVDKIGEGGMGVVYRAEDLDLGRQVALKVLHTEFVTDDERRRRFMREARTAASISHPNIATIHEVGEADGVIYIAMKLVEGHTLNRHVAKQEPDIDDCLRIAIEIGEGLAGAHQANIVHRDLKPENIVIDAEGRVNILDFGLAKLYGEPGEEGGDSSGLQTISASVTRDGRILGTVQYMSPEQARGVELDARSDVFSLGIVLFEMVTGQLPFKGDTITDTLTSILRDEQPPIATFNPRVPVELERIIARCLRKDPQQRYQNAGEVLADLRRLKRTSDSQPVPLVSDTGLRPQRRLPWKRIAGFAAAALLLVAVGAGAAGVLRSVGWLPGGEPQHQKLAVLPFENLQERDDPERLGQILQELIITDLTGFESLKVLSSQRLFDVQKQLGRDTRTSIDRDVATRVAQQAGADVMLTGSLSRLGSTWILTCQLIDLRDGSVLQSDRIDGSDLYAMVDGLTEVVRRDLDVAPAEDLAVTQQTSSSLEAYQAYLAGVDALNSLDFPQAIHRFEEAVTVDPSFGKAYYKLAISRWWKSSLENFHDNTESGTPSDALNRILEGNAKVPRKDRLLAEAFLELVESRPAEARPLFENLVELYPDEKEAHYGLGEALFHSAGSGEDQMAALEPFERAIDLDPSFSLSFYHVVDLYIRGDRLDEGIRRVRGFIEEDPDNLTWYLDLARLARAKDDDALFEQVVEDGMRRVDSRSDQRHYLTRLAMMTEDLDRREALLDRALAIETDAHQQDLLIALGQVAAGRREMDRAEALFTRAHEMDPRSQAGLNALFTFYEKSRRPDTALEKAKRLVGDDANFPPYIGHWAAAAIVTGDPAEIDPAIEAFETAVERDPEDPGPLRTMGPMVVEAWLRVEDYARAEQLLLEALDVVDPATSGVVYNRLGWVSLELAKPADAEDWFRRAYEHSIMKEGAIAGLFRSALIREEYERAAEYADKLVDLSRGTPWTRAMRIEVDVRAGREPEADRRTRQALDEITDEQDRRFFLRELSEAYLAAGRFERASELGRQAKTLEPEDRPDGTTAVLLAWSLMNQDLTAEAGEVIETAAAEVPEDVRLDLLASFNALMEGDAELAELRAASILERGPAIASAHVALAYALGRQGRFEEAMPHAERALRMRPDRTSRTLASWVLIAGEIDLDRGLELAVKAVDTPDSYLQAAREISCVALAEHCLGIAFLKQGRYEEAVEVLSEASRLRPDHALIREQLEQAASMSLQSGS